ncbi:MAG: 16S rRNA (guanine(527)-N(7))-methyltransferase RsmG [Clostridia bacterium]
MEYKEFKDIFVENEKKININIDEDIINKFYQYMKILLEWNEKINLTAITDEKEIIKKHFIDCLTILQLIEDNSRIIDVGTGAGFPGIPLAISRKVEVTLLDSLNKRINFLNEVKNNLKLDNVFAIHGRAEELAQNNKYREMYDVAVSRAVAPMNILLEYLLPFVKVGGTCICMKGPKVLEELNNIENIANTLGGEYVKTINLKLDEEMERNIVVIRKISNTNKKYPRKPGIPTKQPLQ